jgi:glycosyltransferase involved in cell wall biosynthesis
VTPIDRSRCRILQVTAQPFPPEIRVVKEGLSLQAAGYGSAVLCPPVQMRPSRETWRGIEVFRPNVLAGAELASDKLLFQSVFLSPAWLRAMREVIEEYDPHVLHVHDIWLGRTAFRARGRQRVVMDLHENMPAAVVEYLGSYRGAFKLFNAAFKNRRRVLGYERDLLMKCDLVLGVVQEARDRILAEHPGVDPHKVVNIENLESKEFVAAPPGAQRLIGDDHFSVLYIGGFGPHRGIDTLIRAFAHLKRRGVNARLHLVGAKEGSAFLAMLRDLIAELDVASHVEIVGWVPAEAVLAYISQASVGTVPHHSNPHTDSTIPHKLFQYMIAARPVLVSTSGPLARTVRAAGAGRIFRAGDALDCADRIEEMVADPNGCRAQGGQGRRYVLELGHNWEEESAPALIAAYDRLLAGSGD